LLTKVNADPSKSPATLDDIDMVEEAQEKIPAGEASISNSGSD